jgi:hypothetical protein
METGSKLIRIHKPNPEAHHANKPRQHAGKKAAEGSSGEAGIVTAKRKMQLPKRNELSKPNV